MSLSSLWSWFGAAASLSARKEGQPSKPISREAPAVAPDAAPEPAWPMARLALAEALWGEGFVFPGGVEEMRRLAAPLGLSDAATVLLLGAGPGGAPRCLATEFGSWVSGFESDPVLAGIAAERSRRAGLARRAPVALYDPGRPVFRSAYFHHALALEPLRGVAGAPLFEALAEAIRPDGQLVFVETVAAAQFDPTDAVALRWAELERRGPRFPAEADVTRGLARGFDVRVVEDVSARHVALSLAGWRGLVNALAARRPGPREAARVVAEAELWLLKMRLLDTAGLRLMRWHAIRRRPRIGAG